MTTKIFSPAGVNVADVSSSAGFELGTEAQGQDGSKWVYVLADEAITQYNAVAIAKDFGASKITKTLVDAGSQVGVAQVAFAAGQYGWVATKGGNDLLLVTCKNGCQPGVALYTCATSGYLDDTAASQTLVNGIVLTDTATSSGAAEQCRIFTDMFPTPTP